ncbi:MAG: response regulator transcription factor [Bacillota bacterium]
MEAIKVVVADCHPVVRRGIRAILQEAGIAVGGETSNGEEALRLVEAVRPSVLVLEVLLRGMSGLEVCRHLYKARGKAVAGSSPAIMVLTAYDSDRYVFSLLESGAKGYVLKDEPPDVVLMALKTVARGETWLSPRITSKLARMATERRPYIVQMPTNRQIEILRLVAAGKTDREIAQGLGMAERTVRYHLRNLYDKLGVNTRAEAAAWAARQSLLEE